MTNVPGPQFPLYLQGRRLRAFYPQVPLTLNTALGIAIMSYDGRLGFGLLGDYDALPDLDEVAADLERSIDELARGGGRGGEDEAEAGAGPQPAEGRRDVVRRLLPLLLGTVLVAGGVYALLLAFNARDDAGVGGGAPAGPGELQPDLGRRHLEATQHIPLEGLTDPPTSGAHHARLPTREGRLSPDQILHALELGDVILFYDAKRPPAALRAVQREVSGPFDAEVAAAGQQVILARREGAGPVTAAAWRRLLRSDDPSDPRIRDFAEAWIGRGADG